MRVPSISTVTEVEEHKRAESSNVVGSTTPKNEGGSLLFETRAASHYFGTDIETTRGTFNNPYGKRIKPANNRVDRSFAKRTERSLSQMEPEPTSKSAIGGSILTV